MLLVNLKKHNKALQRTNLQHTSFGYAKPRNNQDQSKIKY